MLLATILLLCPLPQIEGTAKAVENPPAAITISRESADSATVSSLSEPLPSAPTPKVKTDAEIEPGIQPGIQPAAVPAAGAPCCRKLWSPILMLRESLLVGLAWVGYIPCSASASEIVPSKPTLVTLGGIIDQDSDDTLAFTPDGRTVFFDRSAGPHKTIMVSHQTAGRWSAPQAASFSGRWFDQDPVVSPDGRFLLFNSDRPVSSGGKPLVQSYFAGGPGPGSNIWRAERKGKEWTDPVWVGPTINSDVFIDFASVASDGTLYFMRWQAATKTMQLWRARLRDGSYASPDLVTLGNSAESIHDPAVAGDQSFIVFDYGKVKGGLGRLCIAFREGEHWSQPIDLGDDINEDLPWGPHLDPDGRTLYITGNSGIQRLSLAPWLDAHRREAATHH